MGRRRSLPLADAVPLDGIVRRTTLLRAGLVLALAAAVGGATAVARDRDVRELALLPPGSQGVLVLDASKSVEANARVAAVLRQLETDPHRRIASILEHLIERDQPTGLVVFSDLAYELLPPGSPAQALAPLVRFFEPRPEAADDPFADDPFIANAWSDSFSGGTLISRGLVTALEALRRDGIERPSILLVSDLEAPGDERQISEALLRIREEGVQLRIVSLAPLETREQLYAEVLGGNVFVDPEELRPARGDRFEQRLEAASPRPLVLAGGLVLLLVAVHERLLVRLPLPARRTTR